MTEEPAKKKQTNRGRFLKTIVNEIKEELKIEELPELLQKTLDELVDKIKSTKIKDEDSKAVFKIFENSNSILMELTGKLIELIHDKNDLETNIDADILIKRIKEFQEYYFSPNMKIESILWDVKYSDKFHEAEVDKNMKRALSSKVVSRRGPVCPKCKHKETIAILKQTRSGDEPMTVQITCSNCGNIWREG